MAPALISTSGRLVALFALLALALALSWFQTSWLGICMGYLALSAVLAQFAFIGHDAGHGSISPKSGVNRFIGQLSMTVVTGLAFDEWIDRHRTHHRFCQVETKDPDMDVAHVIALTAAAFESKGRVGKFLLRYQYLFIWPLALFFGQSQRHLSQLGVFQKLHRYRIDVLVLILHFSLWFGVPCFILDVPFSRALLGYVVPLFILGPHLAAIFWINHIGMPLIKNTEDFSFFEHQYVTSRSISSGSGLHWFFGGLNFQIEHHLFPQVPSYRLRRVKLIVQRHFANRQIAYAEISWFQAVRAITLHLRALSRPGAS